jgi:hypothetical protein
MFNSGFLVLLAYLGAEANEFLCSEWERKGMHTMFIELFSAVWV